MAELGETSDPGALVPGKPEAVEENARVLRARTDAAADAGEGLKRIDTGSWTGPAATSFREKFSYEPVRWIKASDSFAVAADVLEDHASTLRWAQGQAAEAIRMWHEGQAATKRAKQAYDSAVAQANAQNQANTAAGNPTCISVPPFIDPGEASRQAARDTLDRARQQLTEVGDRTAGALRGEADTAPENSNWIEDAGAVVGGFATGAWHGVTGLAQGAADVVYAVADPGNPDHVQLTDIASASWHNITHPVDFAKSVVAWDDWADGHPGRALGQITGGALLGGAAVKFTKTGRDAGQDHIEEDSGPAKTPEERAAAIRDIATDAEGNLRGVEDSSRVRMVSLDEFEQIRIDLNEKLGAPDKSIETPKGKVEVWQVSDDMRTNITYRSYSNSGGPTIDINRVEQVDVKRFHIPEGGI